MIKEARDFVSIRINPFGKTKGLPSKKTHIWVFLIAGGNILGNGMRNASRE